MLWTCFAANGTVHFLAACFVERASFALQSARFRNNAHVYSRQSTRSKNKRGERRRLYKRRLQSTRLEPLRLKSASITSIGSNMFKQPDVNT